MSEMRSGLGWDSHRIAPGRKLILGGIVIPSEFGFEAHSDGDILSHAVTDALLGAAALGDIGMHFPDTDPKWKDASSGQFLAHAAALVRELGFTVSNVDSTVILERPKLKNFRLAIRESLARTLELEVDQISVKFKTAEGVGPVGEGKSGEAQAVVLLQRRS